MSTLDLSRYAFDGGENAAPIENLSSLPAEDQDRLVLAGIDVNDRSVSGAFMQLNHAGVHCETRQDGLELMDIRAALKKYDGLPRYYWQLLDPDKDAYTRLTREHCNGGYFVRARKGVKVQQPVQSCMFIKGDGAGQSIHNIVIVEEGAEMHVLGGCATAHNAHEVAHLGITEYFVEKGGKLTFTMIHNWSETAAVRAVFFVDPKGVLRVMIYYPLALGRNFDEIRRVLVGLQTIDAFGIALPADWRPGDEVIVPMKGDDQEKVPEGAKCYDWFFCTKPLPKEEIGRKLGEKV